MWGGERGGERVMWKSDAGRGGGRGREESDVNTHSKGCRYTICYLINMMS